MDTTLTHPPARRGLIAPLTDPRTYTALTHHLLGLPLGIAYFTWIVSGLATGAGLAITLVGIPILTLVLATVRPLVAAERRMANGLLDARIPEPPHGPPAGGLLARAKAHWTDRATWRGLAYLLARFPAGTATFSVAVGAHSAALYALAAPIVAPFDTIDLGVWQADGAVEGLALVPLGLVLLLAAAWISRAMAGLSRRLARWGAGQ